MIKSLGLYLLVPILFSSLSLYAQKTEILNTNVLDSLMLAKDIKKAESTLNDQLSYINTNQLNDSLYNYTYYVGKIELLKSDATNASAKADAFYKKITSKTSNKKVHYKALLKLADFYDEIANKKKSLELTKSAYDIIGTLKNATPDDIGKVEYNVGATYLSLGDIREAKRYFQKALVNFESYPATDKGQLSDGYNAVGATMWMSSKLDSAKYYYSKAIKTIQSAKGDPIKNLYLSTVIMSNVSLLEYTQGNLAEAVAIQIDVIMNYEKTIKTYKDENVVSKAKRFQARAISNLAVFYNEQGNLKKAYELLLYAYEKKKSMFESEDSDLGSTLIQIGQSQLSLKEYDTAMVSLQKGFDQLNTTADDNPYWKAAAKHGMAEIHAQLNHIDEAKNHYDDSEALFKKALGTDYDKEFLFFLRNKALFLAKNGNPDEALDVSKESYDYVLDNGGDDNFDTLKQLLNLAEVNFIIKNYQQTLLWVDKGIQHLEKHASAADSKQIEFNKPQLILLKSKAIYELQPDKSVEFLKSLLQELNKATLILEERKTTVFKSEDINVLLSDYQSISAFSEKLTLDLYTKTKDTKYLDKLIALHESSIYNRIRSRLNLRNSIAFKDIPDGVLKRESAIKQTISSSLNDSEDIEQFLNADNEWKHFLDSLKTQHPKYYKMRYGTIEEPLDQLQKRIPDKTTLVRYLYIDDILHAFIVTKTEKKLFKLKSLHLEANILQLNEPDFNVEKISPVLVALYNQLWKPFERMVTTEHVIIIPDRQLFNLSFEMLTPKKINRFSELATNSLLSKHIISYNYSLLLIDKGRQTVGYEDNFVAFVPEFNDKMKSDYEISIKDSLALDKAYLTLLPQPFTLHLAQESTRFFNGSSFLNKNSTEHVFKNEAKDHKIIHIGTHAESNNISPELSRLVFAKSSDSTNTDDNYLYTYEIYNTNLSSNLAILTACETGKPTYQAGEGMISLAHAFNYAGSESILTSLWKIDEQSSAKIIDRFYKYISKGWAKDKALQQAKLDYLTTAEGRTAHPQYWAGLVLIGDASPIALQTSSTWMYWLLAGLTVLILVIFLSKRKLRA